jgi:quinol monooxygenase YgiN
MYARTTTIDGNAAAIDSGAWAIRDAVMPTLERLPGCIGFSLVADRVSGRCIATSAWKTEAEMRASMPPMRQARDRAAALFGGAPETAEWEIAAMHRESEAGTGACVRVTWCKVDRDQIDRGVEIFKVGVLPALQQLEGFCGASLMIDRASSGLGVSSVAYDSFEAMERNRGQLDRLRDHVSADAGAQVLDECDFELMIAHLRLPELV